MSFGGPESTGRRLSLQTQDRSHEDPEHPHTHPVIVGGLNWGLVGAFNFDLVATIFGAGSLLARLVYVVVGLSALWQLGPLIVRLRCRRSRGPARTRREVNPPRTRRARRPLLGAADWSHRHPAM